MTTISSVSSAWSSASVQRASRPGPSPERLLSKIDTDGSGGVSDTELQGLLDNVAKKTGASSQTSAADLVKQYDANGDGSLNAGELGKTLQSVLPPPPSTMAFAQSRGGEGSSSATSATGQAGDDLFGKVDSDGDGAVSKTELQALLEAMSGGTASQTGVSSDDVFSQLDTDGDGSLTQAEFDAGRPSGPGAGADDMQAMGGMPPPPGGPGGPRGAGGADAASDSSSATSYDPLDTNEDGKVSAAERLAGGTSTAEQDAITALFNAIDTDGDASISASESKAFIDQLTSQVQSTTSTSTESTGRNDLARLADFARQQYERAASDWRTASNTSSLSAVA
ncbi:XopAW family type III secretion system calcium-binding effector [Acidovorax sp. K2F]|uniref:XopAW family type III secretion system calcium-binding effector n=1 Tax=Acidovorax sp. K2F TaxID=2978125 RepID=UPI0021B118BE|nr:XopAW family type III secretion system calcium-binding effector [Acidovorax sp. K2F]MCT6718178.1 EF-hand domain-containing protein [Acidovorax sp. K2F]